jgi:hypothetical protein
MFSGLGVKLAAVGAFLLAVGLAFLKVFNTGRKIEKAEQLEKASEAREKMDSIPDSSSDDTIDSLRDEKF